MAVALAELGALIAPFFVRPEPRRQAIQYVAGLLSNGRRKNSWGLAHLTGDDSPWRMQRLLNRARWDADAVRGAIRAYLATRLGHPDGVLVLGEAGVVKKGIESVAVVRQYTELTRQVENCQISVMAAYAAPRGSAIVDHELFLPREWTADLLRCRKAGVPEDRMAYRDKPELARRMILRAVASGLSVAWVTGDVVYGRDPSLRAWLEARRMSYALAVPASQRVTTHFTSDVPVAQLVPQVSRSDWVRYREGRGRGEESSWARIPVTVRAEEGNRMGTSSKGFGCALLIRRRPGSRRAAFYLVGAPEETPTRAMAAAVSAAAAGRCWRVAREQAGMNEYEVRTWAAWYRHSTLAMVALAALSVSAAVETTGVWSASSLPDAAL